MVLLINTCYGGYGFSEEALNLYHKRGGKGDTKDEGLRIPRNDQIMIDIVKELGEKANNRFSHIAIVEIPDDAYYKIQNHDGAENLIYSMTPIQYGVVVFPMKGGE